MNFTSNSLVIVVVFYVEHSHLDFLYVTVYETFVKLIRSDNVNFVLERHGRVRLNVTAIRSIRVNVTEKC